MLLARDVLPLLRPVSDAADNAPMDEAELACIAEDGEETPAVDVAEEDGTCWDEDVVTGPRSATSAQMFSAVRQ